jgi:acyl-CoA reductase-like NAD-dependent aldehyde dehydrogenase
MITTTPHKSKPVNTNLKSKSGVRVELPQNNQQVLEAINPATGEVMGTVPITREARIPEMVASAQKAQEKWGLLPFVDRAWVLGKLRDLIIERASEISETISFGMGKPLVESLSYDVAMVIEDLTGYIDHGAEYLADEPVEISARFGPHKKALIRYVPRGVVCVIAPWNFPFELAMTPSITALAAGNAVIVKPTSSVPLLGKVIERLFNDAFKDYPGLAQVVHGPGALGSVVATSPGVDFVAFTGSTPVGRKLLAALGPMLRPSLMELGGCDPLIVCDDANLERAANATVFGRFSNNGQICAAVKRVYVQSSVAEEYLAKVLAHVRAVKVGPPTDSTSDVGPLANDRGHKILRELLQDALDKGAKLEIGGVPELGKGLYWKPTVLTNVNSSMRLMKEETFGPILPIQVVKDDEEAIALANDTEYGLDAYVFSSDLKRANRIANRLKAGSVDINEVVVNYSMPALPFGGVKQSGINRYHGKIGLRLFTDYKAMVIDDGNTDTEPYWFPYTEDKLDSARKQFAAS